MSTIKANRVEGLNGNLPLNLLPITASAWVNFNGIGTVAIRDSHNISSVTDKSLGNYAVNYQFSLGKPVYSVACSARRAGDSNGAMPTAYRSTGVDIQCFTATNGSVVDCEFVNVAVFGGQS